MVPASKLSVQVGYLEENPAPAGVLGRQEWMQKPPGAVPDQVYGDLDGIPLLSLVIRRSVLLEIGEFCDPPHEDMDMMIRLRAAGHKVEVRPEIVLHRRYHGGNLFAGQGLGPVRISSLKAQLDARRARGEG